MIMEYLLLSIVVAVGILIARAVEAGASRVYQVYTRRKQLRVERLRNKRDRNWDPLDVADAGR